MSTTVKTILALGLVAFIAACAQQEEPAPAPAPVMAEPVTGKY
jgi:predicted outer membrane protein